MGPRGGAGTSWGPWPGRPPHAWVVSQCALRTASRTAAMAEPRPTRRAGRCAAVRLLMCPLPKIKQADNNKNRHEGSVHGIGVVCGLPGTTANRSFHRYEQTLEIQPFRRRGLRSQCDKHGVGTFVSESFTDDTEAVALLDWSQVLGAGTGHVCVCARTLACMREHSCAPLEGRARPASGVGIPEGVHPTLAQPALCISHLWAGLFLERANTIRGYTIR